MPVQAGKKRYQVALTEDVVNRFQKIAKEMKMPQGIMSIVLDEALEKVTVTMERLKEKGTATFADLFQLIGATLDEAQKEVERDEKEAAASRKKTAKTDGKA